MKQKVKPIITVVCLAALCTLAAVLALGPVLRVYKPLLAQVSPRELRVDTNTDAGRFAQVAIQQQPTGQTEADETATANLDEMGYPVYGEEIGNLQITNTLVNTPLYYGDGTTQLHYGAGIYDGAYIPGEGSTVLVAGHTATHFSGFNEIEEGTQVAVTTYYGNYVYEVVGMQVAEATDTTAYDLEMDRDYLIMYTCYPFGEVGYTPYRYFVYAELVSGPEVVYSEGRRSA